MTDEERAIVEKLGDVWNMFLGLPVEHQTANLEFSAGVHALQNHVAARSAYRTLSLPQHLLPTVENHPSDDAMIEALEVEADERMHSRSPKCVDTEGPPPSSK